jgi:NADPH:quinone reductase-like Zn-dependent oxidoreductase
MMPLNFPWIPGGDFSGVVEAVGPDVTAVKRGESTVVTKRKGESHDRA